ncbi:hypothetical protein S83_070196 [Arachis hypogaea]
MYTSARMNVTALHVIIDILETSQSPYSTLYSTLQTHQTTIHFLCNSWFLNANCVIPLRNGLATLSSESCKEAIACFITDVVSQAAADEVGIPRLALRTTCVFLPSVACLPTIA